MSDPKGDFVWYELVTTDPAAAQTFYEDVVGWRARDAGMNDRRYTILSVGDKPVGGMMELPSEGRAKGAKPGWIGYVGIEDVDATVARLQKAGGTLHRTAEDIPGVGRFAVVADPQGASLVLFTGLGAPGERHASGAPGSVGWRELHAGDMETAFAFYAELFGWRKAQSVDMGPMGIYQLFDAGAEPVGGMITRRDASPFWLYYFCVDHVDAAGARVTQKGGQILNGPHEVPGGSWILQCRDPQGAMFALVGPQR